jgi:PAS domain S-box-containing protein
MIDAGQVSNSIGMELIDCIELPVLVVGRDLALTSFNPAAGRLLSLTDSDHGRQLQSIQMFSKVKNLQDLCEHVIAGGSSHRAEVDDGAGSWFSLNINRLTANQEITGAVLTLTNVTAFRESLERAIEEREYTKAVINTIADALVIVDADIRIQAANHAFYALFQTSRERSQGTALHQLGSADWDVPALRSLIDGCSASNGDLGSLECTQKLAAGRRSLLLNARRLNRGDQAGQTSLITIQDITERKNAIEALRESEQRFRVITEAAPILVWMSGTDKICYYFNKGWLDFVGRAIEQEVDNGWVQNVHPDDFDRCLRTYVESFDARQPFEMEYRLLHRSGQYRWILDHGVPRYAPGGTFEGYVGGCLDIHDQKEAAEKVRIASETLRKSEESLRLAQQVGTIGTFEWNLQTNVNRWTPELEAIYGLQPGQFPGTHEAWQRMLHPDDRAAAIRQVEAGFQTGAPAQAEWRTVWPDGSIHWILGRWQVFKDDSGEPTRMTGINIDITSRKNAEQARRHLAAIVESSHDSIIGKDLNGIVTSWNPGAEKMFGYSAKEMIGRPISTIIPAELHEDERRILDTIRRGEQVEHFETVRLTKDGERVDVSLSVSPVRDDAGRVIGASKTARDITYQKKTEQALRMTERLASVGRMAATVAHEINNPLESVTNLVYLAKSSHNGDEIRGFLNTIEEELNRISQITKQSLGFYRERIAPSAVRAGTLLNSVISLLSMRLHNKKIEIRPEIRQDPEIYVVAGEIRQLIANLLNNSIDAVGSNGLIRIRVDANRWKGQHQPGIRITIADSGPGIPQTVRSKVFEPFFTTKKDVGTGLGLWVCTNIVQRHHGSIRMKSCATPGRSWTAFSVFLPAGQEPVNDASSQRA